jgi:hypothetical protein
MACFVLQNATIAVGVDEAGKRTAVTLPAGTEIIAKRVPIEPRNDRTEQITVLWDGRSLTMFMGADTPIRRGSRSSGADPSNHQSGAGSPDGTAHHSGARNLRR